MISLNNIKILLIRNDNIGDLICTTPAIEALRKAYPTNQIDIVVNSYNHAAIYNNPFVDNIYCYTKPKHKNRFIDKILALVSKIKIILRIKKQKYKAVVVFRSGYSKSAELFSRITNATYKVGVKNTTGRDDFNIYIIPEEDKHEVEFCFECLRPFGIAYNSEDTKCYVNTNVVSKYQQFQNYILFHISSRVKSNKYDKNNFKQVIDNVNYENILISAEPNDYDNALWIEKNTKAKFVKAQSFEELSGLIKNIKLIITLDGGVMHLAPALGVKTITISGKTNMNKWYPWGYKELVVQDASKVASNINPEDIIAVINQHL